jgi:hypothetical protein
VNAPDSIIPSMPMFTTPTRSQSTPARPAKAMGTARTTVACKSPISESDLSAVAQVKNAITNNAMAMPRKRLAMLLADVISSRTPRKAMTTAATMTNGRAGTTSGLSGTAARGEARLNTASPVVPGMNSAAIAPATAKRMKPMA